MRRGRPILLPAFGLAAGLVLAAGCGGGGSGDSEAVATTTVTMAKSYRFDPQRIRVAAGETVTWTNDDNFTHTVRVDGGDDHKVDRGDTVSIRFDRPGTYHYVCTLHRKDMDGTVIVR
jgi:plastocyanin